MENNKQIFEKIYRSWLAAEKSKQGLQVWEMHLSDLDVQALLSVEVFPKWYWKKINGVEVFAAGKRKSLEKRNDEPAHCELLNNLKGSPDVWFGGIGFAEGNSRQWKGLNQEWFFSPYLLIEKIKNNSKVSIFYSEEMFDHDLEKINQLFEAIINIELTPKTIAHKPILKERSDTPEQSNWNNAVFDVVKEIKAKQYSKCVLARQTSLTFSENINGIELFQNIATQQVNCYSICISLSKEVTWISFTPEVLYKRIQSKIQSMALAGTKPRGQNERLDKELESELLDSKKERNEHSYVADFIQEKLSVFCESIDKEDTGIILKQKYVQHVLQKFNGVLKEGVTDKQLVSVLHPTPAVCGYPQQRAFEAIRRNESFDRGWYTGVLGVVSPLESEWVVGIRSALVRDNHLYVFAGAGIVEESIAAQEWQEIEYKMKPYLVWAGA